MKKRMDKAPRDGAKVLLVDDDELLREVFCSMLSRRHQVVGVGTGNEAIEQMTTRQDFDVVVCDMQLPDIDGRGIYRRMQQVAPEYTDRMIFCTGGSIDPQLLDFLDAVGEERVLNKPCTVTELLEAVAAARTRGAAKSAAVRATESREDSGPLTAATTTC